MIGRRKGTEERNHRKRPKQTRRRKAADKMDRKRLKQKKRKEITRGSNSRSKRRQKEREKLKNLENRVPGSSLSLSGKLETNCTSLSGHRRAAASWRSRFSWIRGTHCTDTTQRSYTTGTHIPAPRSVTQNSGLGLGFRAFPEIDSCFCTGRVKRLISCWVFLAWDVVDSLSAIFWVRLWVVVLTGLVCRRWCWLRGWSETFTVGFGVFRVLGF